MSSKKKPSLSPRKLFETEELPHFGFYSSTATPPDFENIPVEHRNIILWIGQYAATYDLEKVVQALTDSFEGIWTFDTEVYGRVMLSALGVFARSQNFKLGQEAINTLIRIDCAKQHPSYKNFVRELKIQIALATVRDDHKKTADFAEAIKEVSSTSLGEVDQETIEELIEFGRLLKSKHGGSDRVQQINNYFTKHSVERFQKEVLQFLKDVKEAQPLPFLELVEKDFTAGKYKPVEAEKTYSYKEIEAAFIEDGGSDLAEVFAQQEATVADFIKKKQNPKQSKNDKKSQKQPQPQQKQSKKPAPNKITQSDEEEEEEEEELKKKKQKKNVVTPKTAAKQLETRETLDELDKASKKLFAHGKDPLSEARRKAPKKVSSTSSSKSTTPQSRPTSATSSAANSADKNTSLLDRKKTAQAVEWNNSDEDLEEDEFMEIEEHLLNTPKRLLEKRELNEPELISPQGGKTVRRRIKWTTEEEDKLLEGYIKYPLQWARIKRKYNFTGRTGVDLKDKYRNLMKHYDDTQNRITQIKDKLNDIKESRIAKGLNADETDSEEEKKRQKESAKKHARKSKRFYDSEPEEEYSEEEDDEEPPVEEDDSDAGKRKRTTPRRLSGEKAKKKIKSSQEEARKEEEEEANEEEEEEEEAEEEVEDLNKTRDEEPEEDENDTALRKITGKDEEEEEEPVPEAKKKTVKKTRRRKRRY